ISSNKDLFGYGQGILPELLNDVDLTSNWLYNGNGNFSIVNGTNTILNLNLDSDLPSNAIKISSIQISDVLDSNTGNPKMVLYYLISTGEIKSINGTVTNIDFGCKCIERVYTKEHTAETNFLELINHLW